MADALEEQIEGFERYLAEERRMATQTVKTYVRDLRALRDFAATKKVPLDARKLDVMVLRAFLASLFRENAAPTMARKISAIKAFYRYLVRRGVLRDNPTASLRSPKVPKPLPKFLTVDDAFRVVEAPGEDTSRPTAMRARDRAILEMLYGCGLRVSELASLTLDRLELDARQARVMGKGSKERLVPVGGAAAEALEVYLQERTRLRSSRTKWQDPNALFLGQHGTALTARQVQNIVRRYGALGAARSDLHPHSLRHTCATHLLDAGADLRGIQELLGHASLSTTQRYTHVSVDRLMEVYDRAHPLAHGEPPSEDGE